MTVIDKSKQYRTRDGTEARIYATDGIGTYPVHGAVYYYENIDHGTGWRSCDWTLEGRRHKYGTTHHLDLIEVKPRIKRKVWVNVYPHRMGVPHGNHSYVAAHRGQDAIACVEIDIDVEEGHGL